MNILEPVLPLLLRRRAEITPDRIYAQDIFGASLTYAETNDLAQRWSGALATLNIKESDRVATMLPTSVNALAVWLGIAQLQAWEIPIHPQQRGKLLHDTLVKSKCKVLLFHAEFAAQIVEAIRDSPFLEKLVVFGNVSSAALPPSVVRAETLIDVSSTPLSMSGIGPWTVSSVCYTSGTTGFSKGVIRPWAQNLTTALGLFGNAGDALSEGDCFYHTGVNSHIGARAAPHLAAVIGGRVALRPSFKTEMFWSDVERFAATLTMLPGPTTSFLMKRPVTEDPERTTLRYVSVGPVPAEIVSFCSRFGVKYATAYGQTETSMPIGSRTWNHPRTGCGVLRTGYPSFEVRIVDEHDEEVPTGTVGELTVRTSAPWTMNGGYLDDPEETLRSWRNGWFHTGDLFRCNEDGEYFLIDRIKDCIRRRGENISSVELEQVAREDPMIQDCTAIGVPADDEEEEVKLVVVAAHGSPKDPANLIASLTGRVPLYMVPRFVEYVAEIPRNAMQRANKAELRANHSRDQCWDRLAE